MKIVKAFAALAFAAGLSAAPANAAIIYSFAGTSPNIQFQYTTPKYVSSFVELTSLSLGATGNDVFEYLQFCPKGTMCGRTGSFQFTSVGDELYFVHVFPRTQTPPAPTTVTLPDGTVIQVPPASVSVDFEFTPGTFGAAGTYQSRFGNGTLTVSDTTAAVPEPASWAMMVMGFGLAGAALRRRRAPAASPRTA